jgi:glycosyltransferase involved in cell wall biosynthesis
VAANDVSALAGALGEVAQDDALRSRLGQGATVAGQRFDLAPAATYLIELYEALARSRRDR